MIEGTVVGDRNVAVQMRGLPERARPVLLQRMVRITLRLMRHVVDRKLSGQVLRRQTGTLARAVTQSPRQYIAGTDIIGTVGVEDLSGPGGRKPVHYGAAHEFGFKGTVSVKSHLRELKTAFGRAVREPRKIQVRAHSRSVNLPARSFLRSSLHELEQAGVYVEEVAAAMREVR